MMPLTALIFTIALSLALSAALVLALARPLRQVLTALCSSGESSAFWVTFTTVMLFIAPLLVAVFLAPTHFGDVVDVVKRSLTAVLFGAFCALLIVGYKIARASPTAALGAPVTPARSWDATQT